jgi:asparagine synthase (glutamine-hydrolysing)
MCGFAGVLGSSLAPEERAAVARRMAAALVHRGPDDDGAWADERDAVALAFRRLAILDLTPEGHQPMASADGRFVIAFNGEIYNFAALRAELEAHGHAFRGHSDTEVLLASLVQWGLESALPRVWGMFAFALWDRRERLLYLARDRMGKKPLYYGWQGRTLVFGSELKALRAYPGFSAGIDREALTRFLRFVYVPGPRSIYEGVWKVPPASWLALSPDRPGQLPAPTAYWDAAAVARVACERPLALSDAEATDTLEELLRDAVRLRSVADVPLGAFLSGGIDSATVVALLQEQSPRPIRTFTIGFRSGEYDESAHARTVARHLGTEHTELEVTPDDARALIPRLPDVYDEPFADSSQLPTILVSQLARRQVTVALSGDGGDEMFAGYHRYVTGRRLWSLTGRIPPALRRGARSALEALPPAAWDRVGAATDRLLPRRRRGLVTGNRIQKIASVLESPDLDAMYLRLVSTWPEPAAVVRGGCEPGGALPGAAAATALADPVHRMMLLDQRGYLPDDILVKVDRASMSCSLEARAPLLDHRVAELGWRLPMSQKIRGREGKWLVRRVLERHVPRALFDRPKQGFSVPIDAWLRGPLSGWARDLLSDARLRRDGFFEPAPIQAALEEHLRGARNHQHRLWAVLMFQAWRDAQVAR